MSERVTDTPEQDPNTGEIRNWFENGFKSMGLPVTQEDLDFLFCNEDGSPVDEETATENAFGWIMNEGLDPQEFGEPGFVEKLGVE